MKLKSIQQMQQHPNSQTNRQDHKGTGTLKKPTKSNVKANKILFFKRQISYFVNKNLPCENVMFNTFIKIKTSRM